MNEQDMRWVKVWEEDVLPDYHENPERALAARLGDQEAPLAAELVKLVRQNYTESENGRSIDPMLDVTLLDVGNSRQLFLVFAASLVGNYRPGELPGYIATGDTFTAAFEHLRSLLEGWHNRPPTQPV